MFFIVLYEPLAKSLTQMPASISQRRCEPKILSKQEKKKFAGFLKIKIKKAKGLKAADKRAFSRGPGKSDPFAVVCLFRMHCFTRRLIHRFTRSVVRFAVELCDNEVVAGAPVVRITIFVFCFLFYCFFSSFFFGSTFFLLAS